VFTIVRYTGAANPKSKIQNRMKRIWIALAIGNSRYHWAWFLNTQLQASWDTDYLTTPDIERSSPIDLSASFLELLPTNLKELIEQEQCEIDRIPIYLCSVVPSQTAIWQQLKRVKPITLSDIPLLNLYSTFGIDRALTLLGAGENYGYPALVIDGGTALTITGVNRDRSLVGGAILPGLRLQFRSLAVGTAALPAVVLPARLPQRWSDRTEGAIASGILHVVSSGIRDFITDWQQLFPDSQIVFTGGDGDVLATYLAAISPDLEVRIAIDRQLIFHGFAAIFSLKSSP
jgi:type III pantothenate kinase